MRSMLAVLLISLSANVVVGASGRDVTIPAGTILPIRLDRNVGSDVSRVEDTVTGHLAGPIVVNGHKVVAAGEPVTGTVTQAVRSGKVKGRARLGLRFHTLTVARERYDIHTRAWTAVAPGTKEKDAATIGLPAAGGAIVGGLIGGTKGALIGGAAGGGAGTAVVLSTRGKEVRLGRGAIVRVKLTEPLAVHAL